MIWRNLTDRLCFYIILALPLRALRWGWVEDQIIPRAGRYAHGEPDPIEDQW